MVLSIAYQFADRSAATHFEFDSANRAGITRKLLGFEGRSDGGAKRRVCLVT